MVRIGVTAVALFALTCSAAASTPKLDIDLAHNNQAEAQTRANLLALAERYDLSPWTWTTHILIEQYAIPHSDPVLTLNTRHDGLVLLSSYVHEQLHRFEDLHPTAVDAAIAEFERAYPGLPVGGLEGAKDERSTYLHIITCYSELQAMKRLVGPEQAKAAVSQVGQDHYRAIYRLVFEHEGEIGAVVERYRLMPN
jgi:hypothetical protein